MVRSYSEISSSSSSPSSSVCCGKYDVFLSFRGEDTRKNFTDHLYAAFRRRGIITFRDDEKLETGEAIAPALSEAIRESWCSVIVLSEGYAFSSWCLEELSHIIQQKNDKGHKVFPIFYDMDPSTLRKQSGKVEEAFAKHDQNFKDDKEKMERWRSALTQVANIKGWHLNNRHESEVIGEITKCVSTKLCQTFPRAPDGMVGIQSRLDEVHCKIDIGDEDDRVRVIGICGMGGLGKTTLARFVYTQISSQFEDKIFLAGVREVAEKHGLVCLQKQLLSQIFPDESFNFLNVLDGNDIISRMFSSKKVLIVIDDTDDIHQLRCLVGERHWFGLGSRIIITTRDEHQLQIYGVDDVYKPMKLNAKEALLLFSLKAFRSDTPAKDFVQLAELVVKYADGLPLALEVFGSFLCGRSDAGQWKSAIERLEKESHKEILDRLQISFDGLEQPEKDIFLDIACFFKGAGKEFVTTILDSCGFFPDIGIDVLIKKSLITLDEDNKLSMHDLLQEMGKKIVRQESPDEPGKRSRLWEYKDIYHVLTEKTATEGVQGIFISSTREQNKNLTLSADAFLKMKKLRLLRVFDAPNPNSRELKYLSNKLRLLEWSGYPFKSFPSSFQPENLVALLLPFSRIEKLWNSNIPLHKLKSVDLNGSKSLLKTPDFSMAPNLESLVLEGTGISDFHPTIKFLRRLKLLNLRNCKSLRSFPSKAGMESLETLILSGCSKIASIPEIVGEMKCLQKLYLDEARVKQLPSSIGHLRNLELLNLKDCGSLESLPSSIGGCEFLKTLNLSGCSKLKNLPENLQQIKSLKKLDLSETAITTPPSFIFHMKNLKFLSLRGCEGPPSSHWTLFSRRTQRISPNSMIMRLPAILSGLRSLKELNLSDCNLHDGSIPNDICSLPSLEILRLCDNNFITLPTTLSLLSKLTLLTLTDCNRLKSLPELPTSIKLWIDGCTSLEVVANSTTAFNSRSRGFISALNCSKFAEDINVVEMLKRRLKVAACARTEIHNILIPGSGIPQWFSDQTDDSSYSIIKMSLPQNFLDDSQLLGFAFCCVFYADFDNKPRRREHFSYTCIFHGKNHSQEVGNELFHLEGKSRRVTEDHLWIHYLPCDKIDSFSLVGLECDELVVVFEIFGVHSKVKKCGVRVVYEKDLEEMDPTVDEHSRQNSSNSDHTSSKDGSTRNYFGSTVKRKWLNENAGEQRIKPRFCHCCQAYVE